MKVGILAGTFDPVHAGHLALAKQAAADLNIDKIVFMPEHHPRGKSGVTPFSHRLAMLKLAIDGHKQFELYDSREKIFTLAATMPKLERKFRATFYVVMLGSDAGRRLNDWEGINLIKPQVTFLISLRTGDTEMSVREELSVPTIKSRVNYSYSPKPEYAASRIRAGLSKTGIAAVDRYIAEAKLYK